MVSYPNGDPNGHWKDSATGSLISPYPTIVNTGGPSGSGYTIINNLDPSQDAGAYNFYGYTSYNTGGASQVSQSIAVYLDPTLASQQSGAFWIDMVPDATINTSAYNTPQLWGAENNFRINGTGSGITIKANGSSTSFADLTVAAWYNFQITWSQGATATDPVLATLSVYNLNTSSLVGSTTHINSGDLTADNQSQNLGGVGYVWLTEWADGFAGNSLNVADLNASAVPEANTIIAGVLLLLPFGVSGFRVLRKRRAV